MRICAVFPCGLLDDFAHRIETIQCPRGLPLGGERDCLQVVGPPLTSDRGKLAEGIAGMIVQNPQRIAARNAGVLTGVAGKDNPGTVPDGEGGRPLQLRVERARSAMQKFRTDEVACLAILTAVARADARGGEAFEKQTELRARLLRLKANSTNL